MYKRQSLPPLIFSQIWISGSMYPSQVVSKVSCNKASSPNFWKVLEHLEKLIEIFDNHLMIIWGIDETATSVVFLRVKSLLLISRSWRETEAAWPSQMKNQNVWRERVCCAEVGLGDSRNSAMLTEAVWEEKSTKARRGGSEVTSRETTTQVVTTISNLRDLLFHASMAPCLTTDDRRREMRNNLWLGKRSWHFPRRANRCGRGTIRRSSKETPSVWWGLTSNGRGTSWLRRIASSQPNQVRGFNVGPGWKLPKLRGCNQSRLPLCFACTSVKKLKKFKVLSR